jgi:hypothetical protein
MIWIALFIVILAAAGFSVHVRFRGKDETDEEWNRDEEYFD